MFRWIKGVRREGKLSSGKFLACQWCCSLFGSWQLHVFTVKKQRLDEKTKHMDFYINSKQAEYCSLFTWLNALSFHICMIELSCSQTETFSFRFSIQEWYHSIKLFGPRNHEEQSRETIPWGFATASFLISNVLICFILLLICFHTTWLLFMPSSEKHFWVY